MSRTLPRGWPSSRSSCARAASSSGKRCEISMRPPPASSPRRLVEAGGRHGDAEGARGDALAGDVLASDDRDRATAVAHRGQALRPGRATDAVERGVHAGGRAHPVGLVVERLVGAERQQVVEVRRARRPDHARAGRLGELHDEGADTAGRCRRRAATRPSGDGAGRAAPRARCTPRSAHHRRPRGRARRGPPRAARAPRPCTRRSRRPPSARTRWRRVGSGRRLTHRGDETGHLGARDVRQGLRPEAPAALLDVPGPDAGGGHLDEDGAGTGRRGRHLGRQQHRGGPELGDGDGAHARSYRA